MNKFQQSRRIFFDTGLFHQQFRGSGKESSDIRKVLQQRFCQRFYIALRNGKGQKQFHDLMRCERFYAAGNEALPQTLTVSGIGIYG